MNEISIIDSLISSLIGILLVFAVLVVLILAIQLMSLVVKGLGSKKTLPKADDEDTDNTDTKENVRLAKGSCGEIKLYDVPDRTAAMLMAITADKLDMPLNQIRFVSIREIKDEERVSNEI